MLRELVVFKRQLRDGFGFEFKQEKRRERDRKGKALQRMLVPGTRYLANPEESKVLWLAKNIGM